jgi:hypothetical protein
LKKKVTKIYNNVAPIVVDVRTITIPHHLPKTKPENSNKGVAKPKIKTQTVEKIKKMINKNAKFSILYFKIVSLFDFINS